MHIYNHIYVQCTSFFAPRSWTCPSLCRTTASMGRPMKTWIRALEPTILSCELCRTVGTTFCRDPRQKKCMTRITNFADSSPKSASQQHAMNRSLKQSDPITSPWKMWWRSLDLSFFRAWRARELQNAVQKQSPDLLDVLPAWHGHLETNHLWCADLVPARSLQESIGAQRFPCATATAPRCQTLEDAQT